MSWTYDDLARLEARVEGLLAQSLPPGVRWALARQAELIDFTTRLLGRQAEELAALRAAVEQLRRLTDGDVQTWEDPDDRDW